MDNNWDQKQMHGEENVEVSCNPNPVTNSRDTLHREEKTL